MSTSGNNGQTRTYMREPARRVFATEFRESRLQFKAGDDEFSPSYVMLPTGERSNRIFICGIMTQKEKKGDQNMFYTARIRDPTGLFFINAGGYQPEAMQQISQIEEKAYVAVVGKPTVRETPDGSVFVSVRAESVTEIDLETYKCWVDDTAEQTLNRLDAFGSTDDSINAKEFYSTNPEVFRTAVFDALKQIEI